MRRSRESDIVVPLRHSVVIHCCLSVVCAGPAAAGQGGQAAIRALTTGAAIYHAGCAGCHGEHGEGAPDTATAFDRPDTFPDFSDCPTSTPEKEVDWKATITKGGHGRGFSPIMPSFEEALTAAQIEAVVTHLRGLCRDSSWPVGELNLPRPLATEKAFPENETVLATTTAVRHAPDVENALVYEHRLGARNQFEVSVPFGSVHDAGGNLARGVGDIGVGLKRVLFAGATAIVSAQGEFIFPTGDKARGLGAGVGIVEAFAAYGQLLPANMFFQAQGGTEQPTSTDEVARAVFGRAAIGRSFRQDRGLGRLWSPMVELLADRELENNARTDIDVLPQFQVTLNQRQHIRLNAGLQIPVTHTTGRSTRFLFYALWDWFDGGLLDGWK
jgi:mono/diheme cytochrome c family protein